MEPLLIAFILMVGVAFGFAIGVMFAYWYHEKNYRKEQELEAAGFDVLDD